MQQTIRQYGKPTYAGINRESLLLQINYLTRNLMALYKINQWLSAISFGIGTLQKVVLRRKMRLIRVTLSILLYYLLARSMPHFLAFCLLLPSLQYRSMAANYCNECSYYNLSDSTSSLVEKIYCKSSDILAVIKIYYNAHSTS